MFEERVLSYSAEVASYLATLSRPIAIVPPSISDFFSYPVARDEFRAAFARLGFVDVGFIADQLSDVVGDLSERASVAANVSPGEQYYFTACPKIAERLPLADFPGFARRLDVEPPADRAVRALRRAYPDATLFFASPCSLRGRSLDVDHEIPLCSLLEALRVALRETEQSAAGATAGSALKTGAGSSPDSYGRTVLSQARDLGLDYGVLSEVDPIAEYVRGVGGVPGKNAGGRPVVREFIACLGGCSHGDWSGRVDG